MKNNFQIVHDTNTHYHIKSPTGKPFTIEKSKLKPEAHEMIKSMCGGGSVKSYSGEDGSTVTASPDVADTVMRPQANINETVMAPNQSSPNIPEQTASQSVTPSNDYEVDPTNPLVSKAEQENKILQQQIQDVEKSKQDVETAFRTATGAYGDLSRLGQTPQEQQNAMQKIMKDIDDDRQKSGQFLDMAINQKSIDPDRYLNQHFSTTGSKVLGAIGLILGGAGAGRTGTNLAAQHIDNAIRDDIYAQMQDQSHAMNLFKLNKEKLNDDRQAYLQTYNQMAAAAQAKLAQAGAYTQNANTHLQLASATADLHQKMLANSLTKSLMSNAMGAGGSESYDPLKLVPLFVPKEQQPKAIDEISKAKYVNENEQYLLNLFDKMSEENRLLSSRPGTNTITAISNINPWYHTPSSRGMYALLDPLIHDQEGRINEAEQNDLRGILPKLGDSDETVAAHRKDFAHFINKKKETPVANAFMVPTGNLSNRTYTPAPSVNSIKWVDGVPQGPNGEKYKKVSGGWQRVK